MAVAARARVLKNPVMTTVICGVEEVSLQNKMKHKSDAMTDFSKLFDISKKKLTSLDSQRVISVVDDLIRRCEVVTLLPYLVENLERFSVMLGSDLCNALNEYDHIQQLHTTAMSKRRKYRMKRLDSQSSNMLFSASEVDNTIDGNDIDCDLAEETMISLTAQLSDIVKICMRLFRVNPAAYNAVKNARKERSTEANTYIDHLILLRDQVFARLVTAPGEEREKQRTTVQVMMREKKAQALIKKLERELDTITKERETMIYGKNEEVRKLKLSIQKIEQDSDLINRKLISEAQKIEIAELKNSDGKKTKLQQEVIQLKLQLSTNTDKHRESELALRKRKYKVETEVENWIQKFDNDMTERQDELDELSEIYAEEKQELEDLQKRFEVLSKEYNEIVEARRIIQVKREEAERELRNMVKAATLLQSLWRAYKCRKALKAKQKRGRKGKRGKKKKK